MPAKQKRKLVESYSYSISKDKLQETILLKSDHKKLLESIDGDINTELSISPSSPYKCYAVIKDIPVTRFTLNLNNRIYSKELWEIVYKKGSAERTFCAANHSESDGDVKDFLGVWHGFKVLDDVCTADLYVIDNELGRSLVNLLLAGALIHFSTFGLGDFILDQFGNETNQVDPHCYELVRLSDWVSVSSQNVITTIDENAVGIQKKVESLQPVPLQENSESKNHFLEASITNKTNMEKSMNESENKMEISYWKNRVKTAIKESADLLKSNKFDESLSVINEVKKELPESDKFKDLHEKVESNLAEIHSKKTEIVNNLSENYSKIMEEISNLKKENEQLQKIAEISVEKVKTAKKEQMEMGGEMPPVVETAAESIETKVDELIQAAEVLTTVIDQKEEIISDLQSQVSELQTDVQASSIETEVILASAEEKVSELKDTIDELTDKVLVMEKKLKAYEGKNLKEETLSTDFPNTPERVIGSELEEEDDLDVSEYVDSIIQVNPEFRENVVHLKQSRDIKAVDRKIQNLKAMKEERKTTKGFSALDMDFSRDVLPSNKYR